MYLVIKNNFKFLYVSIIFFIISELLVLFVLQTHIFINKNMSFSISLFHYLKSNYISSICIWDCTWYSDIVSNGYSKEQIANLHVNWAFFPLFPFIAKIFSLLFHIKSQFAVIITSKLFFLLSIFSFIKLIDAYKDKIKLSPWVSGMIVAFNPYSIYGHSGYSESIYFFLNCTSLFFLHKNSFYKINITTSLLTSSRLFGIFIYLPIIEKIIDLIKNKQLHKISINHFFVILFFPIIGLLSFILYLYILTGDGLAFLKAQSAWGHSFKGPFLVIYYGWLKGGFYKSFVLISFIGFGAVSYLFYKRYYGYALYLLFVILLPLSSTLLSLPRFIFWQPIFLFVIACWMQNIYIRKIFLPIMFILNIYIISSWFLIRIFVT